MIGLTMLGKSRTYKITMEGDVTGMINYRDAGSMTYTQGVSHINNGKLGKAYAMNEERKDTTVVTKKITCLKWRPTRRDSIV